jgi:hypothetical protein
MNGNELLRRLRKVARQRGLRLKLVRESGKGSHATLYFGDRYTLMKDRKKEIGPGLLVKYSLTWAWKNRTSNKP